MPAVQNPPRGIQVVNDAAWRSADDVQVIHAAAYGTLYLGGQAYVRVGEAGSVHYAYASLSAQPVDSRSR
jgi:hypothetical protein